MVDRLLPDSRRLRHLVVAGVNVAKIQVGRHDTGEKIDCRFEPCDCSRVVTSRHRLQPHLIFQEGKNRLAPAIVARLVAE
jgi:hypothetical protein